MCWDIVNDAFRNERLALLESEVMRALARSHDAVSLLSVSRKWLFGITL